jgi:uncharacterized protein related to proFAR isomerase
LPEKPQDGDLGFLVAIGRKDRKKKAGENYGKGQQKVDKKVYQPINDRVERAPQTIDIAAQMTRTNRQYVADAKKL